MKKFLIVSLSFLALFFTSCTGDAKIILKQNGSVSFAFSGQLGEAFKEIMSGSGTDLNNIDVKGMENALKESGFDNIKVNADSKKDLITISFEDINNDSYLFSEDIINVNKDDICFSLTADQFLSLYNASGEDIQMLLDLFLSPVLNDEVMSEEELEKGKDLKAFEYLLH